MKNITPFNLRQLPESATLVLIGKRNSGKTTTILNILHHFQNVFEFGYIFCGSTASQKVYRQFMPHDFVQSDVTPDIIDRIINYQERRAAIGNIRPIFLCFDDLNFNQKLLRSKQFFKIFANGRHSKIFFVLSLQYALGIGPGCRGNIDAVILHKDTVIQNQKKLFDGYVCGFDTFNDFRNTFNQVAHDRRVMVCMKSEEQNNDFPIYHWRPHYPIPPFRMNAVGEWWTHRGYHQKLGFIGAGMTSTTDSDMRMAHNRRTRNVTIIGDRTRYNYPVRRKTIPLPRQVSTVRHQVKHENNERKERLIRRIKECMQMEKMRQHRNGGGKSRLRNADAKKSPSFNVTFSLPPPSSQTSQRNNRNVQDQTVVRKTRNTMTTSPMTTSSFQRSSHRSSGGFYGLNIVKELLN